MEPVEGQEIYIGTSLYLSRGADDFIGGKATIDKVDVRPANTFITIKERPGTQYGWRYVEGNQKKWAQEYKDRIAHPDPDLRQEFNTGW